MPKLYIAKNKFGKYYAKIKNPQYNIEKIVSVNLPSGCELTKDYGTYECEFYLSCYQTKTNGVELVIKITKIHDKFQPIEDPYAVYNQVTEEELPF